MTTGDIKLHLNAVKAKIDDALEALLPVAIGVEYEGVNTRMTTAMTDAVSAVTDVVNPTE